MAKLSEVHNIVFDLLVSKPETRGDDYLLIYEVLKAYKAADYELEYLLKYHAALGLPSFETITRCRRKIQAEHEGLTGKAIRAKRKQEEAEFKEYAKSN